MTWVPGWNSIAGAGWWSNLYFWLSIISLLGLGVFEVISHRYAERKDNLVTAEQQETQRRHEEDMARVQSETSAANTRAANLEIEAARANQQSAEIMKATAWRQFQPAQIEKLVEILSKTPSKAVVAWIANDSESFSLAAQFTEILNNAHWQLEISGRTYPAQLIWGITVPPASGASKAAQTLREAFGPADVPISTNVLPAEIMSFGAGAAPPDFAVVLFGSKKSTFAQPPY